MIEALSLAVPITLVCLAFIFGTLVHFERRKALRPYWQRECAGIKWQRRFPNSSKTDIREFLNLFVDAFLLSRKRRCCFRSDDKLMDLYHALYPPGGALADAMELETLSKGVKKRYGVDLKSFWRQDVTLGEIYQMAKQTG